MTKTITTGADQPLYWARHDSPEALGAYFRSRWPAGGLVLVIMLVVKRYYSQAGAAQLDWVLAPTAGLVAWFTPADPVLEYGVGYVDFNWGIIIAPACAGINFMIMAFGLAAFYGLHHLRRRSGQLVWSATAMAGAYAIGLVVNTVRIAFSSILYQADIYSNWWTVPRVHRLTGVVLYFGALWLYYLGLRSIIGRYCRCFDDQQPAGSGWMAGWLPLGWYLLGAVGVPLVNGVFRPNPASMGEHCATVVAAGFGIQALVMMTGRLIKGVRNLSSQRCRSITAKNLKAVGRKGNQKICRPEF